jgi:hypothetical protein
VFAITQSCRSALAVSTWNEHLSTLTRACPGCFLPLRTRADAVELLSEMRDEQDVRSLPNEHTSERTSFDSITLDLSFDAIVQRGYLSSGNLSKILARRTKDHLTRGANDNTLTAAVESTAYSIF